MIDVTQQINAARRKVGTRVLEAGAARTITISRIYDADVEDVWDACTNAERIPRWFLPVSGELRLGGRYQLEGNAGGTIEQCDPPKSFVATWEYDGKMSWIEVRLTVEATDRTRLEIEHIVHADDHWAQFGPGAVGIGWELALIGLDLHLSGRPTPTPQDSAAWAASEEGKRFVKLSGDRWCETHIACGDDEVEARAMAERTIAAYTATSAEAS